MYNRIAKLSNYRQIAGIAVAAIILTVIFAPFQKASAFTVNLDLPNADPGAVPTSAVGSTFRATVDVEAGELISISQIELILDNGQSGVKHAIFDSSGKRTSGDPTLVRGNLAITLSGSPATGYGYGYGLVSYGTAFSGPYSYAFSSFPGFVSGNTGGSSNPVGNQITGLVGPGTITIEGKLNTAQMDVGSHTLDVLIEIGTGVSPETLVAPQLSFTTTGNSALFNSPVNTPNPPPITVPGAGIVTLSFSGIGNPGQQVSIESSNGASLNAKVPNVFTSTVGNRPTFNIAAGGSGVTAGPILIIDVSAINATGPITITIPYFPNQVPAGFTPTIFHYNEDTGQWSIATNVSANASTGLITGTLNSLSPVVAGILQTSTPVGGGTGTGAGTGGGGGGGSAAINLTTVTYPESYFMTNPLAKMQLQTHGVVNNAGASVFGAVPGQQVNIQSSFRNFQQVDQNYAIIIQVVDQNGFTLDISWVEGTLPGGEAAESARSWTAGASGNYTIRILVWDGVSASPIPLSEITTRSFTVS